MNIAYFESGLALNLKHFKSLPRTNWKDYCKDNEEYMVRGERSNLK
jgi:hypothetical protein